MQSSKPWFETWFNHPLYLQVYAHRDDSDARMLLDLVLPATGLKPGDRVLDLACGAGRHALELAAAGFEVTGVDLAGNLLAVAEAEATRRRLSVSWIREDMRYFRIQPPFSGIFSLFTSFGYFDEDRENFSVLKTVADHLVPGGVLVFDYLNPEWLTSQLIAEDEKMAGAARIHQKRRIEDGKVKKQVRISHPELGNLEFEESVKLYPPGLFRSVLPRFGFLIEQEWGSYDGAPVSDSSPRYLILARRTE